MIDVIFWVFFRRLILMLKHVSFRASFVSYVDGKTTFEGYNRLSTGSFVKDSRIGRGTYIAGGRVQSCDIGSFCSIGPRTRIGGLGRHPTDWISTHPVFFSPLAQAGLTFCDRPYFDELVRVRVGNDVWIGAGALVLDGVSIGDGAIVAAGAVVVRDVEPYSIVGGIPARVIRQRFCSESIECLQALCWWNWPLDKLHAAAHLFRDDSDTAVKKLRAFHESFQERQ